MVMFQHSDINIETIKAFSEGIEVCVAGISLSHDNFQKGISPMSKRRHNFFEDPLDLLIAMYN